MSLSKRRPRGAVLSASWSIPEAVDAALAAVEAGAPRDTAAVALLRAGAEHQLYRLRLPRRDRRQASAARLAHAVRLRVFK